MLQHIPSLLHTMAFEKKSMVLPTASLKKNKEAKSKAKKKLAASKLQSKAAVVEGEEGEVQDEAEAVAGNDQEEAQQAEDQEEEEDTTFNSSIEIALFIVDKGTVIRSSIFEKKVKRYVVEDYEELFSCFFV